MKRAEEVLTESKIRCLTAADGWRRKQEVCLSAQLHPRSLKPLYFLSRSSCDKELLSLEPPGSGFCSRRWAEQRGERLCEKQNYLRRSILELQPVQVESTFKVSLQPPPTLSSWPTTLEVQPGVLCFVPGPGGASVPAWAPPQWTRPPCVPGEGRPAGAVAAGSPEEPESCCRFIHHAAGQPGAATAHLPGKLRPPGDHPGFAGRQRCWRQQWGEICLNEAEMWIFF